jgi:membrane protease YdiL (CAAX protease family)
VANVVESVPELGAVSRRNTGLELLAVLGVSFAMSGLYALLSFIRAELTIPGGIGHATATVVQAAATPHPWLDFADDLADVLNGVMAPFLALVLLARSPGGRGFGIGLDRLRPREALQGVGFLALIGIPGLGLVWAAHSLGLNASLQVVDFPDVWYRVPMLLLNAFQDGLAEEVVVAAFVLTRLRQLDWADSRALGVSAVLRGSYHLYQGLGGFFGNFVMGLIFGWWFQRTRRVWPLVIAHFLLDAASFVGYVYLKSRISWI